MAILELLQLDTQQNRNGIIKSAGIIRKKKERPTEHAWNKTSIDEWRFKTRKGIQSPTTDALATKITFFVCNITDLIPLRSTVVQEKKKCYTRERKRKKRITYNGHGVLRDERLYRCSLVVQDKDTPWHNADLTADDAATTRGLMYGAEMNKKPKNEHNVTECKSVAVTPRSNLFNP